MEGTRVCFILGSGEIQEVEDGEKRKKKKKRQPRKDEEMRKWAAVFIARKWAPWKLGYWGCIVPL